MTQGHVDNELRALVPIQIGPRHGDASREILAWVDTAFNGSLVIPQATIDDAGLEMESTAEAVLADGNQVMLATYGCCIQWFGNRYDTQVAANDGAYALLGTMLLDGLRLEIDYAKGVVTILQTSRESSDSES